MQENNEKNSFTNFVFRNLAFETGFKAKIFNVPKILNYILKLLPTIAYYLIIDKFLKCIREMLLLSSMCCC